VSGNITPKPSHPREKYVSQDHFPRPVKICTNPSKSKFVIGKFGSSEELLDVAEQKEIRGNQIG
jgi:hypothetical protein